MVRRPLATLGLLLLVALWGCHLIGGAGDYRIEGTGAGGQDPGSGGAGASGGGGCAQGVDCPLGAPCEAGDSCATGLCVDGVCCLDSCEGLCASCSLSGFEGVCRPHPAATDPESDCSGGVCDGGQGCAIGQGQWVVLLAGGGQPVFVTDMAADPDGHSYVVGRFQETVDFGAGPVSSQGGKYDAFVAKYDGGSLAWLHTFGNGSQDVSAEAVTVSGGQVVIVGEYQEAVDFGAGLVDTAGGRRDVFVAAYGSDGAFAWVNTYGNESHDLRAADVVADDDGRMTVAGQFKDAVDFGAGPISSAADAYDAFVLGLDSLGGFRFLNVLGNGTYDQHIEDLAVTPNDHVAAVGRYKEAVDFGAGAVDTMGDRYDAFAAVYDPSGQLQWLRTWGNGTQDQHASAVASDRHGAVVVAGRFKDAVDFGGGSQPATGAFYDGYVVAYDGEGVLSWLRTFGDGLADQRPRSVAGGTLEGVVVAGSFRGTVDFGGKMVTSAGERADAFVVRYGAEGTHLWTQVFGNGAVNQRATAVTATSEAIVVAGELRGTVELGDETVSSAADEHDGFVWGLSP